MAIELCHANSNTLLRGEVSKSKCTTSLQKFYSSVDKDNVNFSNLNGRIVFWQEILCIYHGRMQ